MNKAINILLFLVIAANVFFLFMIAYGEFAPAHTIEAVMLHIVSTGGSMAGLLRMPMRGPGRPGDE